MAATRLVVVVLPLLPVMPTIGPGHCSMKARVIESIGMPRFRASSSAGASSGTLWEAKTTSLWATASIPLLSSV